MLVEEIAPQISVDPATIAASRRWLQDAEIMANIIYVRDSILIAELPNIEEVPFHEWCEEFETTIIVTKTSALFDSSPLECDTPQFLVARKTWARELRRCSPKTYFPNNITLLEMLQSIHKTAKLSKAAVASAALTEICSIRITNLGDLGRLIPYLQPRIPLCEMLVKNLPKCLGLLFYSQLESIHPTLAKNLLECDTSHEIMKMISDVAVQIVTPDIP
ncbi:hypothetical protein CFIMG_008208RA00001 [Ceratocystis fimbriata CBS 114723]|uniref:Uncharacterized protein n=1 Tax=Ceratocystis fimbriata CBS 114723 TaxID=1035309 RepID=A0A2C5WX79_9PEZI|nr:hypothetical protein CFIMG_008208RA00001 [Ceratocystis fimbriata CBS 114723]